ncbi:hypothetical protein [Botrimarina sp.]|uniref:hypothetical protein n=1 Tax=Botrimarina sp. TaxID=2795802 RepID=UPI0032F09B64
MHRLIHSAAMLLAAAPSLAATFQFGSGANGLVGVATGEALADGVTLQIAAGPDGALLDEAGRAGLGVDSRPIAGVSGNEIDKFDVLAGATPLAGVGESITFSFDKPGRITRLNFDGVKDESLEHFVLTGENGQRVTFFDSAANVSAPGAVDSAIAAGAVSGQVVYLLEDALYDDDAIGLSIPFEAGEQFLLTYAELGAQFGPTEAGNGARLTSITVQAIPEPCSVLLVLLAAPLSPRRRPS